MKLSQISGSFRRGGRKRSRAKEKIGGNKGGFLPEEPSGRIDAVKKSGQPAVEGAVFDGDKSQGEAGESGDED